MLYVIFTGVSDELIEKYRSVAEEQFSPVFLEDLSLKEGNNGQEKYFLCPAPEFRAFSLFLMVEEDHTYDLEVLDSRGKHWIVCRFHPSGEGGGKG